MTPPKNKPGRTTPRKEPTELELCPDKTVRWKFKGKVYVLREPSFGDLRELESREGERLAEARAATTSAIEQIPDDPTERTPSVLRILADAADRGEQVIVEWWQAAFKMLERDGKELPVDDCPSWIVDPTLPGRVLGHWKTAPPLHGGLSQ